MKEAKINDDDKGAEYAYELTELFIEQVLKNSKYKFIIEEARWHSFDILAFTEKGFGAGFEVKSDRDNVNRFLEQLPKYSVFLDYVYLVLGEGQKMPKWLPSWVGIYQLRDTKFEIVRPSKIHHFPDRGHWFNMSEIEAAVGKDINPYLLWRQLKIWFANSCLAYKYGKNAIRYDVVYAVVPMKKAEKKVEKAMDELVEEGEEKPGDRLQSTLEIFS